MAGGWAKSCLNQMLDSSKSFRAASRYSEASRNLTVGMRTSSGLAAAGQRREQREHVTLRQRLIGGGVPTVHHGQTLEIGRNAERVYHLADRGARRQVEEDVISGRSGREKAPEGRREVDLHLHGLAEAALLRVAGTTVAGLHRGRLLDRELTLLLGAALGQARRRGGLAGLDLALEADLERGTAAERDLQVIGRVRRGLLHAQLGVEPHKLVERDPGERRDVLEAGSLRHRDPLVAERLVRGHREPVLLGL